MRKGFRRHPNRVMRRYVRRIRARLVGTDTSKPWRFQDYSLKQVRLFGKLRGLWRVHFVLSEILETQLSGKHEVATALVIQLQKCLQQVALDRGSWAQGELLLETEDPLGREAFAAEPEELENIHKWMRAMKEVKTKSTVSPDSSEDQEEEGQNNSKKKTNQRPPKPKAKSEAAAA